MYILYFTVNIEIDKYFLETVPIEFCDVRIVVSVVVCM